MTRHLTNIETIKIFEQIGGIKEDNIIPDSIRNTRVLTLQNGLVEKLSFLVYSNARKYKQFPNYEDLVQEGFVGLIKAIRRFNYKLFPNFFVYSERWIQHNIKRAASRFDVVYSPNRIRVIYSDPPELLDTDYEENQESQCILKEASHKVREELNEFTLRDREIVGKIFGLDNRNPQSLRAIGSSYNLTHERIRQIKNKIILKLRENEKLTEIY